MGCSESKPPPRNERARRPSKQLIDKKKREQNPPAIIKEKKCTERKTSGKLLTRDEKAEPHYMLDDMMRSGDHLTQSKQRQGHAGALMLAKAVHTYNVLFYGLSESGKTHLLYTLINGSAAEPVETDTPRDEILYITKGKGQNMRANFSVTDVGGAASLIDRVAGVLKKKNIQGVVYVVDLASGADRIAESRERLNTLLSNSELDGKPVLIIGSKTDLPNAISLKELEEVFEFPVLEQNRAVTATTSNIQTDEGLCSAAEGLTTLAVQISSIPEICPTLSSPRKRSFRTARMG
eukprot:TRINITY_DN4080_c1_g1_i1.p1 TRINITY_DN4080_c1_g1~~TRINITY_DN4080_c1_g1_i1.p1  ORF type:complete len:314 (+),score=56.23 TRINITY_DN4080_c1_g1_i1:64-942(+)